MILQTIIGVSGSFEFLNTLADLANELAGGVELEQLRGGGRVRGAGGVARVFCFFAISAARAGSASTTPTSSTPGIPAYFSA